MRTYTIIIIFRARVAIGIDLARDVSIEIILGSHCCGRGIIAVITVIFFFSGQVRKNATSCSAVVVFLLLIRRVHVVVHIYIFIKRIYILYLQYDRKTDIGGYGDVYSLYDRWTDGRCNDPSTKDLPWVRRGGELQKVRRKPVPRYMYSTYTYVIIMTTTATGAVPNIRAPLLEPFW